MYRHWHYVFKRSCSTDMVRHNVSRSSAVVCSGIGVQSRSWFNGVAASVLVQVPVLALQSIVLLLGMALCWASYGAKPENIFFLFG